jgi:hypothetical protein
VKNKVPYTHSIDTYHKNCEVFGNGDYPSPFSWTDPTWLKGRPEKLTDPRPARTRYYYKYLRSIDGHPRWLATWEDALSQEAGGNLIMKSIGVNNVDCISREEYNQLRSRLRRMKITDYEA